MVDLHKSTGWLGKALPGLTGTIAKTVLGALTGNKRFAVVGGEDAGPFASLAAIKEAERLNAIQAKIEAGGPVAAFGGEQPSSVAIGSTFQGDKSFLEGRVGSTVSAPAKKSTRAFIPGKRRRADPSGGDTAGTK